MLSVRSLFLSALHIEELSWRHLPIYCLKSFCQNILVVSLDNLFHVRFLVNCMDISGVLLKNMALTILISIEVYKNRISEES